MKHGKLRLELDHLQVESFDPGSGGLNARGTVQGLNTWDPQYGTCYPGCPTRNCTGDPTDIWIDTCYACGGSPGCGGGSGGTCDQAATNPCICV